MPLHAQQFFTDHLALPFDGSAIIGDSCYAKPQPHSPLRLRIDFAPTIRHGEYDGLRLRVLHPDKGVLDTAILTFADHSTFTRRDAAREIGPGWDGYARIRDWHQARTGEPPWKGADVSGLRRAIEQYAQLWFPDDPPHAAPTRTALPVPTAPVSTTSVRTR
ncbi:hypothetical protein ABZ769_33825 [Streptomyces olivoreticuli]